MKKIKKMLPYFLVMVLAFYLLPFLLKDTGMAMVMLLVVVPLICLGCSAAFGAKNGFSLLFCMSIAILYVPTIFIFYNSSAWVYIIFYGVLAIIGDAIGMIFYKHEK